MLIGVPLETAAGETRVAVTPETAKKYVAQGHTVQVQGRPIQRIVSLAHKRGGHCGLQLRSYSDTCG